MYGEKIRADDAELFGEVVEAILSVMGDDAVKIILYGSVARGDNTPESDVDIAVLTAKKYDYEDSKKLHDVIFPIEWKYETIISVVPIDSYHYFRCKYDIPFYMNIEKEGVTLWKMCA